MLVCNIANIIRGKKLRNDPVRIGIDTVYICLYSVESICALVTLPWTLIVMIACDHNTAYVVDSPLCCLLYRSVVLYAVV
jgi:hypothetical protein